MRPTPPASPFLLALFIGLALVFLTGPAAADIFIVDCEENPPYDYNNIQDAVSAAVGGTPDTIIVRPCTYVESVLIPPGASGLHIIAAEIVDTELLGAGSSGVGAAWSSPRPTIDGILGYCMTVDAQDVSIQGLYLIDCGSAGLVAVSNADRLRVHDTVISSFDGFGIRIEGAEAPSLTSNWIYQVADDGIRLQGVSRAFVADTSIQGVFGPGSAGIWIGGGSQDAQILRNEIYGSFGPGIHDRNSSRSRIERNTALGNCTGMPSPGCTCDQILVGVPTFDTDVAGNDSDTGGDDGISLCTTSAQEEENPGI